MNTTPGKPTTATTPFTGGHEFAGMFPYGCDYMPHASSTMMPYGGMGGMGGMSGMGGMGGMSGMGGMGGMGGMMPYGGMGGMGGMSGMMPFGGMMGGNMMNFNRMFRDMERMFSNELTSMPSRPASMMENYTLANPIRMDAEGNRWLNCCFDMRSYKPEEINVTFNSKERCICIEASHEIKDSKEHYVKRHYMRKFTIPESLAKEDFSKMELKSCLTNDGMLCIEAALPKMAICGSTSMSCGTGVTPLNVKVL